jgi:ABC-type polar amino acid transport system ATPase subunit
LLETNGDHFIALRGITKRFGSRLILDDITLSVAKSQTVALIGPSGGGKSTLLRCINGLNGFDQGEVQVGPHRLLPATGMRPHGSAAAEVRRLVGMVFQDFQLFPHFTALENIIEAPTRVLGVPKEQARQRAMELLSRVGLAERADAYPQQLSGGQKQRVAIARALAMEPAALLCDEITSALDPELKNEVLSVLEDLKSEGMTLLLVTHEIGFARRAADRVIVLAGGKIIEDGPPEQVIDRPRVPRTQQFLSRVLA